MKLTAIAENVATNLTIWPGTTLEMLRWLRDSVRIPITPSVIYTIAGHSWKGAGKFTVESGTGISATRFLQVMPPLQVSLQSGMRFAVSSRARLQLADSDGGTLAGSLRNFLRSLWWSLARGWCMK